MYTQKPTYRTMHEWNLSTLIKCAKKDKQNNRIGELNSYNKSWANYVLTSCGEDYIGCKIHSNFELALLLTHHLTKTKVCLREMLVKWFN